MLELSCNREPDISTPNKIIRGGKKENFLKIMIVEDDEALGKALKMFLEHNGYEVIWAKEADEAISLLSEDVKMYLLDIDLPGKLSGFDILKKIKEFGSPWRDTPVAMLSNESDIESMERATTMGANDYFIKSNMDLHKLVDIMRNKFKVR